MVVTLEFFTLYLQELLDKKRADCARHGLVIRPTLFEKGDNASDNVVPAEEEPSDQAATPPSSRSPSTQYSKSRALFLQTQGSRQGVLSLVKARREWKLL